MKASSGRDEVVAVMFRDLVRNVTQTEGAGPFVLGAPVSGFDDFRTACSVGDHFYYSAVGIDRPEEYEVGEGVMLHGGVIERHPIGVRHTDFSRGLKSVSLIAAAEIPRHR